jgi:hypothetical protein
MRRLLILALVTIETGLAAAIFSCSLQLSHALVRSRSLGDVAATVVRSAHGVLASSRRLAASTRRMAVQGVRVRITIGDA